MAKNMSRKGIALAAAALMGASLLTVAAPAQAAGELTLVPAIGTKWAVPSTNGFGVKAYFSSGYSSSEAAKLKFAVTTNGGYTLDAATSTSAVYTATTDAVATGTLTGAVTSAGGSPTYAAFEVDSAVSTNTYSLTVQAFIDANADGKIGAGEWTSTSETITFLKIADASWSLDIVDPTEGDTTAEARVTSSNINLAQLTTGATTSQVAAVFYDGATLLYTEDAAVTDTIYAVPAEGDIAARAMSYDSDKDALTATSTAATALSAGDTIKADIYFEETAAAMAGSALDIAIGGSDGLTTAVPNDVVEVTRSEAVTASKITALGAVTTTASTTNTATATAAVSVRNGATALVATSTATYETGITAANVTFKIAEPGLNSLVAGSSISAGGKTLTNANTGLVEFIEVVVVADADGVATLNMTMAGLTNTTSFTNSFTVIANAEGLTGALGTYTVGAGTAASLKNLDAVGVNADSSELVFPVDSAFSLRYAVLDTFGSLLTEVGHTVTVSDGTNSWSANVLSGYATVAIPAYTSATTKTMTPIVYKNGAQVTAVVEPVAEVTIGTSTVAASVTGLGDTGLTSGAKKALNLKVSSAADTRIGENAPEVTASTNVVITGVVKDSNLDGVATSVTVSSEGMLFEADGVWMMNSITVQSTAAGAYTVDARSNYAGKKVVTVTSGAATVTEELFFADAADDKGVTLTVNAPVSVSPGSTLQITGSLVDVFGNPVTADGTGEDFNFTYSGPGYAGAVPTVVSDLGTFQYNVLLGSQDTGMATITVGYDLNEDGDYSDTGDILVTKTVIIGAVASATKVTVGTYKGYVAVFTKGYEGQKLSVRVASKWHVRNPIVDLNAGYSLLTVNTGAGYVANVIVYIDGVEVERMTITTK